MTRALLGMQWAGIALTTAALLWTRHKLERAGIAVALDVLAVAVSAGTAIVFRHGREATLTPSIVVTGLVVAAVLSAGDGWVFGAAQAYRVPVLGSVWPLAAVMAAGVCFGPRWGLIAGLTVGLTRLVGATAPELGAPSFGDIFRSDYPKLVPLASVVALYAVAGGGAGYLSRLLQSAEQEIAAARMREELGRKLHDGVLQVLAVVERRSEDPLITRLAREQQHELRGWLFGSTSDAAPGAVTLGSALRAAAIRFEDVFGGQAQVLVADDLPELGGGATAAIAGAVGEALTNAGKHGRATRATVFVEPDVDGGIFCSVKDDGAGFDTSLVDEGIGLTHSVRARIAERGGRVEVDSGVGRGTEVRLWLPADAIADRLGAVAEQS